MIAVDVNVLAYLLIEGEMTPQAQALFSADDDWISPRLWRSEFRNVLAGYVKQGLMSLDEATALMADAVTIVDDGIIDVDSDRVLALAVQSGCTAYEMEYVSLAESLGISLVTADKQVLKAFPAIASSLAGGLA